MSLAAIREQIKVIAAGTPGIGRVHDFHRWSADWTSFLQKFLDSSGKINVWMFGLERSPKRQVSQGEYEKARIFLFRGIMGLKDAEATGIIFDDFVDLFQDRFDAYETLNGTCLTINPDWGPMEGAIGYQVELIEHRKFGSVLCHYTEGHLCAIEQIQI